MKHVFALIVIIHGLIHLIGFFKKIKPDAVSQVSDLTAFAINKNVVLIANLSLFACLLFIAGAIGYYIEKAWWLIVMLVAIILSQLLIVFYWNDAKWGTIINLIIAGGVIIGFAQRDFNAMVSSELDLLYGTVRKEQNTVITKEMLTGLPAPVQSWLMNSGIVGREKVQIVHLKQKGLMRSKPGQENWSSMRAEQYFSIDEPGFIWQANIDMMPGITIRARDRYMKGKGEMKIKILSLVTIANSTGPEIDQGTLQRWLAEICWVPSAALSPYIRWQLVDSLTAQATMTYRGVSGSVIFHFNSTGDITGCTADRFMSRGNNLSLEKWEVKNTEYGVRDGIRIPIKSEATWKLKDGDFTWLKLEIGNAKSPRIFDANMETRILDPKEQREWE